MVETVIQKCNGYYFVQLPGACDIADIETAILQLYRIPDFTTSPYLLLDLSKTTEISNAQQVIRLAIDFYHKRNFSTAGKTALLLPDDTYLEQVQIFKALASPLPVELQTFADRADAENWLAA